MTMMMMNQLMFRYPDISECGMNSVSVQLKHPCDYAGISTCQPYHWIQICSKIYEKLIVAAGQTDWIMFEFDDFCKKYRTPMFPQNLIEGILFAQHDYWCNEVLQCLKVDNAFVIRMWHGPAPARQ